MTGAPWFKMFPRDWISGTRGLSDRARGVYIDLIVRIHDLGRPLDHDERDLCRYLGYRDHRQLRPILKELTDAGKIEIKNGLITNGRAMDDVAKYSSHQEAGKKGGRPKKKDKNGTSGRPAGDQRATSGRTQGGGIKEKQHVSENPPEARSQKPERKKENTKKETDQDFEDWWQLVPLKKSKGRAKPVFKSALKRTDLKTLRNGMARYAAEVRGREAQYIKHPVTWINGDCWLDESAPSQPRAPDQEEAQRKARIETFKRTGLWDTEWGPRPDETPGAAT